VIWAGFLPPPGTIPAPIVGWSAQFYRRAYLFYIDATKRRPDERVARIDEVVGLLAAGIKQRR
jgi:hypothetical protein